MFNIQGPMMPHPSMMGGQKKGMNQPLPKPPSPWLGIQSEFKKAEQDAKNVKASMPPRMKNGY